VTGSGVLTGSVVDYVNGRFKEAKEGNETNAMESILDFHQGLKYFLTILK
jgi:hypothetical protein